MESKFVVRAEFDPEAGVWVAEGMNFPGLVTEARSLDELRAKLEIMVPEALEENGLLSSSQSVEEDIPFELVAMAHGRRCHAL